MLLMAAITLAKEKDPGRLEEALPGGRTDCWWFRHRSPDARWPTAAPIEQTAGQARYDQAAKRWLSLLAVSPFRNPTKLPNSLR